MQVKAFTHARVTRIAYLISDSPQANEHLTIAVAESFARWGGRYGLIVPLREGSISASYFTWLKAYDPDAVISFTELPGDLLAEIHREVGPLVFRQPAKRPNGESYGPRVEVDGLSSLSALPQILGQGVPWGDPPKFLLDAFPQWIDDGLIGDNFGTLRHSMKRFPSPPALLRFIEPMNLLPPDAPADRYRFPKVGFDISSDVELLMRMARAKNTILTLHDLASRGAPEIGFQHDRWAHSFNLVVGDHFVDRVSFWNSGLLSSGWRRSGLSAFRVPPQRLKSPEFVEKLVAFINARNWIGQSNSPPALTIRSYSLSEAELAEVESVIRPGLHSSVRVERIASADDCCPSKPRDLLFWERTETRDQELLNVPNGQLRLPVPSHVIDREDIPGFMREGSWMVDAGIERHVNLSRYSNVVHHWQLPKRRQLTRTFFDRHDARINRYGSFSVLANSKLRVVEVRIPEDDDVFATILHGSEHFAADDARHQAHIRPPFEDSRRGDKGQYLMGVLELFGGLDGAISFLSSHFWRNRFLEMAAPNREPASRAAVVERLKAKLRPHGGEFAIRDDDDWGRVADAAVSIGHGLRMPRTQTTLEQLQRAWLAELELVRTHNPTLLTEEHRPELETNLRRSLRHLRDLGVFAQGRSWRCRSCGHRNWSSLRDLDKTLECEICKRETALPVEFPWQFQLNEFLATSLRDHDTLSLVWALGQLRERADNCFAFLPPTELQARLPASESRFTADAEVDLLCLIDGSLAVVEAKDAPRQFTEGSLRKLEQVGRGYRPDSVVIACMSDPERMKGKLRELEASLSPLGVRVELLALDEEQWNDPDHFLPY